MRLSRGILFGIILLVISIAVSSVLYSFFNFTISPASNSPTKTVFYEVKKNETPQMIAGELEKLGIVRSANYFYWYARLTGKIQKFKAGDYKFSTKMKPAEMLKFCQ